MTHWSLSANLRHIRSAFAYRPLLKSPLAYALYASYAWPHWLLMRICCGAFILESIVVRAGSEIPIGEHQRGHACRSRSATTVATYGLRYRRNHLNTKANFRLPSYQRPNIISIRNARATSVANSKRLSSVSHAQRGHDCNLIWLLMSILEPCPY